MGSTRKARSRIAGAVLCATVVGTVGQSTPLAHARPYGATRCAQLSRLKSVFPSARSIGFLDRHRIRVQEARAPIWSGRCGAFWTTYEGMGASIDLSITLYATPHDVLAPLAEPLVGTVRVLPNGARVRTHGPDPTSVNNTPGSVTWVLSAYRNVFISSNSTSVGPPPVTVARQLSIHRRLYAAARSLR